jgi:spermidine/putrescine-binding protein
MPDIADNVDVLVVGFSAQPRPKEVLDTVELFRGRLQWFDHHEWAIEDLVRLRAALGRDSIVIEEDASSPLGAVTEVTERRSRFTDKLVDLSARRLSETDMQKDFASGDLWIAYAWPADWAAMKAKGLKVAYMTPKEGRLNWCCGLVLQTGAPHPEKAHELMDAMLDPKAGAWLINYGYGHSNKVSFTRVTPELLADRGFPADPTEYMKKGIFSRDNKRLDDLQQMFEAVMAGT